MPKWLIRKYSTGGALFVAMAIVAIMFASAPALAALGEVGFEFRISEKEMVLEHPDDMGVKLFASWDTAYQRIANRNMPFIDVTNLSSSTGNLTEFNMTIGDTDFEFSDEYFGAFIIQSDSTPDVDISSVTSTGDLLTLTFGNGGLAPGEVVRFGIDIDADPGLEDAFPYPDFRLVLFDMNNMDGQGGSDNSVITALFEDPEDPTMSASASTQLEDYVVTGPESQYFNQILRPYSVMEGVDIFDASASAIPEPATATLSVMALSALAVWWKLRA